MKARLRAFYESIENSAKISLPSFPTFEDGHRELLLCEAVLRSHREGRWIEL